MSKDSPTAPRNAAEFTAAVNRLIDERSRQQADRQKGQGRTQLDPGGDVGGQTAALNALASFAEVNYIPSPLTQNVVDSGNPLVDQERVVNVVRASVFGWRASLSDTDSAGNGIPADAMTGLFRGWSS